MPDMDSEWYTVCSEKPSLVSSYMYSVTKHDWLSEVSIVKCHVNKDSSSILRG